jgi:glycerol-3-phosphate cytidylyltransferase
LPPNPHRACGGYLPHELPVELTFSGTKAYIGGTFDLLHPGHLWLLKRARSMVDCLIVSLNTDEFTERYKKRRPFYSLEERMRMVRALRVVDGIMINEAGEDSKDGVLRAEFIGPPGKVTHIVHGSDWTGPALLKQLGMSQAWLDEQGIEMMYLDLSPGYSTTSIRQRVIDSRTEDDQ